MKIKPTPETIWKRPTCLNYSNDPITEAAIAECEEQLGLKLPQEYLDLLWVQNGGSIRFHIPDSVGHCIAGIGSSYSSLMNSGFWGCDEYVDFSLKGLVPFDGDGHWFLCLDYRQTPECPGVSYIDIECNSQHKMTDSFSQLLNMMELDPGDKRVLTNVEDFDDGLSKLSELLGQESKSRVNNIGIAYNRFQVGEEVNECLWISSNVVAASYRGDKPAQFVFEGEALQFPELPKNAVIFECPTARLPQYQDRLSENGFELLEIEAAVELL